MRKVLPPIGGTLDLSPLVVIVDLPQLLLMTPGAVESRRGLAHAELSSRSAEL